jgi:hypothetical protein
MGPENNGGGSEKIEVFLTLSNVKDPNSLYKIITSICNNKISGQFSTLGETDSETGNNIVFNISFIFDYYFEKEQILKFDIVSNDLKKIATVNEVVGKIMGSRKKSVTLPLNDIRGDHLADLIVDTKNNSTNMTQLFFRISCLLNDVTHGRNNLDLFYLIHNFNDKKNWRKVYKSKEVAGSKGQIINFPEVKLMKDEVCGDNNDNPILFEIYDSVSEKIGICRATLNEISNNSRCLIYPPEANLEEFVVSKNPIGEMNISYKEQSIFKFLDYLNRGMQINFIVGIDFTCSNGSPTDPKSLHYMGNPLGSPYERAVASCGKIVAFYDYDQKFPVYGFGGYPPNHTVVSHCFNLNFTPDPYVEGIDGVIACYKNAVPIVRQHGPTYFAPLIQHVRDVIKEEILRPEKTYYILMILTDGIINDMDETCNALVSCDVLPLSVIIIGIGQADFSNMNTLGQLIY